MPIHLKDASSRFRGRQHQPDPAAHAEEDLPGEDVAAARERGRARIEQEKRSMAEVERRAPLRGRLLRTLADAPATPSELARAVGAAPESVSRELRGLRDAKFVRDERVPGDRRRRQYTLTPEGEWELGRHRAFGAVQAPPPPPADEQVVAFLRLAIERAVERRRKANALDDAARRLRAVLLRAEQHRLPDVALDAMAELATTLRQDRRLAEVDALLGRLDAIARGQVPEYGPTLVLPAAAHWDYALGRCAEGHGDNDLSVRATHLVTAAMSYQRLSRAASGAEAARRWRGLQAWSIASLADNLREQSRFEAALDHAAMALQLFDELGDAYGRSRCLFLLGFCWRLLGDFDEAWQRLCAARSLAAAEGYLRFEADALMQMGEVRRCQGNLDAARELLVDALARARALERPVTTAFAQAALGAVEYERGRFREAREALRDAHALFADCQHQEGLALTGRRQAAVLRRLAGEERDDLHGEAERLIADAIDRYRNLRSPAGITACVIEEAQLQFLRYGKATTQIAQLKARLSESNQSQLVELDPWVPSQLAAFAHLVGDDALVDRAQLLLAEGRRRLVELRPPRVPRATPTTAFEPADAVVSAVRGSYEMGGETRSQPEEYAMVQVAPVPVLA